MLEQVGESVIADRGDATIPSYVSPPALPLQGMSKAQYDETPRRKLSLDMCTPSPVPYSGAASSLVSSYCSPETQMDISGYENDSPFLQNRLLSKKSALHGPVGDKISTASTQVGTVSSRCFCERLDSVVEEPESFCSSESMNMSFDTGDTVTEPSLLKSVSMPCHSDVAAAAAAVVTAESGASCKPNSIILSKQGSAEFQPHLSCSPSSNKENLPRTHPCLNKKATAASSVTSPLCHGGKYQSVCERSIDILLSSPILHAQPISQQPVHGGKMFTNQRNLDSELASAADLPNGVGLGSSSSFLSRRLGHRISLRDCSNVEFSGKTNWQSDAPVTKKYRSNTSGCVASKTSCSSAPAETSRHTGFVRWHSANEVTNLLSPNHDDELIGNRSGMYCLPTVRSCKHHDLKAISCHTLSEILHGKYADVIQSCVVIDCRYPYEYEGGHIQNSINIYSKDDIIARFITSDEFHPVAASSSTGRTILIFHCEFSSERGPRMMRFLRNEDRLAHSGMYPAVYYPEMYLLDGGYKAFFENYSYLCVPNCYKPMTHNEHLDDLRHFRAKSKTWAGEPCTSVRQMSTRTESERVRPCRKLP